MRKKKKVNGISRIDSGSTHGWFVRAYRNCRTHSKFFSDRKYGGKNKALALAKICRDELVERLGPRSSRRVFKKANKNNKTGVIGVSKGKRTMPNGTARLYFVVSWSPQPNVSKYKSFSIDSLGEKRAFDTAVKFRKSMERQILDAVEKPKQSKVQRK